MCTSIILKTKNNNYIMGRSNEFIAKYNSSLIFIPRDFKHKNTFGTKELDFPFANKFSYLGLSMEGIIPINDLMVDGINENGLSASLLYFDCHSYKEIKLEEVNKNNINYIYLTTYILGNFKSVKELREKIYDIEERIYWEKGFDSTGFGTHIIIADKSGDRIVIEPENKRLILKENKAGVLTNSPSLEEHNKHLKKFSYLFSTKNNVELKSLGNNLIGLPGDFSSLSRFVRASIFSSVIEENISIKETIRNAFQILHTVDVIPGYIANKVDEGKMKQSKRDYQKVVELEKYDDSLIDYTDNFIVKDLSGLKLYYKTYGNISPRFVDLGKIKNETEVKHIYIDKDKVNEFKEVKLTI